MPYKYITLDITQDTINEAIQLSAYRCPVALTMRHLPGLKGVSVYTTKICIDGETDIYPRQTLHPRRLLRLIKAYDKTGIFPVGKYKIRIQTY